MNTHPTYRIAQVIGASGEAENEPAPRACDASGEECAMERAQAGCQKPLDDPRLQQLFGDAIEGALAFGFQGNNAPPEGHWLQRFWNIGRAEATKGATLPAAAPGAALPAVGQEAGAVASYPLNRADARCIVHALESATQRVLGDVSHKEYKQATGWQIAQRLRAFIESGSIYLAAPGAAIAAREQFQQRVKPWLLACFGEQIAGDREERNHRFLEEALELVQACGCTASEAHQLVDYTFGRPVGEKAQEVGGVMVTLAALCLAHDLDMHAEAETELARIWTMVEKIRAKQAAKPKHSPLPEAAAPSHQTVKTDAAPAVDAGERDAPSEKQKKLMELADRIDHEELWRWAGMHHYKMTPEQKDRMNAGVELRRYAQIWKADRWIIVPPVGPVRFSASTLDKAYEMAKKDDARRTPPASGEPS